MKIGNAATPVALVVLAIGTAGYAYFVDRGRISDADRAGRSPPRIRQRHVLLEACSRNPQVGPLMPAPGSWETSRIAERGD